MSIGQRHLLLGVILYGWVVLQVGVIAGSAFGIRHARRRWRAAEPATTSIALAAVTLAFALWCSVGVTSGGGLDLESALLALAYVALPFAWLLWSVAAQVASGRRRRA